MTQDAAEARFATVFAHLGAVTAYARRRGSADPDGIAAEVMTIAWRRLADVPRDDPRPWLYATARNLVLVERRGRPTASAIAVVAEPAEPVLAPELLELRRRRRARLAQGRVHRRGRRTSAAPDRELS